ncbi:hypothetical protein [Pseudomonas syringae group sp. J309-1]|uniref:hypothetical protein n=1 Tax=Pseudomonas syringae group sp. J309-1 TaxID=3079588 RepID=UPI000F00457A|nr:hypothetical protein [Pseudomonas syringae group sp. J309-1]MCQ2995762.1 hypothetical protein [Pseudomonas syringae]MDU8359287.1 hypothetical protein [Pseudomonas syringae group sp. J309-1]
MKSRFKTLAILLSLVLSGCDESTEMSCPDNGEQFWLQSLDAYFLRHPEHVKTTPYELKPGASYDSRTNWWTVPFDIGQKRLKALMNCEGHIEISGRKS